MTLRRPGGHWRLLVHEWVGRQPDGTLYGTSHTVTNSGSDEEGPHSRTHVLPESTEFDELVVGRWLHVEQVDAGTWWLDVGGLVVHVTADRDGRPTRVSWELDRRDGVAYDDGLLKHEGPPP